MSSFESYRAIVPSHVEDKVIRDLLKKHGKDQSGLEQAINALWEDNRSTGSEWVTTSKNKKSNIDSKSGRGASRGGGRGGTSRGRGNSGKSAESRAEATKASKSHEKRSPIEGAAPSAASGPASDESKVVTPAKPEESGEVKQVIPVSAAVREAWGGKQSAWAGPSLVERIKQQELQRQKASAEPEKKEEIPMVETSTDGASPETTSKPNQKSKNKRSKSRSQRGQEGVVDGEVAANQEAEAESTSDVAVQGTEGADNSQQLEETAVDMITSETSTLTINDEKVGDAAADETKGLLKMGKWEAPVGVSEMNSYQFGFGSLNTGETDRNMQSAGDSLSKADWTVTEDSKLSVREQNIWSETTPANNSSATAQQAASVGVNSLFPQESEISGISSLETSLPSAVKADATLAPPGLDPNGASSSQGITDKGSGSSTVTTAGGNAAQVPSVMNQNNIYQPPYGQVPPGITANRPNVSQYGFPFDAQNHFMHLYSGAGFPPGISQAPISTTESESGTVASASGSAGSGGQSTGSGSSSAQQAATGNSGPAAQQFPPAPFPFGPYGNPYYNQAFFYGQPHVANYYGQGRGLYHQRGPYGTDPYGANPSMYPQEIYGSGQYPGDATGSYGAMMPQGAANSSSGSTGKHGKGKMGGNYNHGTQANSHMQQAPVDGNIHAGNNYGYMNPQAWSYPNQAGAWGAQMMQFPGNTSAPTANGFGLQAGQQQPNTRGGGAGNDGGRSGANSRAGNAGIGSQTNW